jgi:hypothetical protein
VEKIQLKSIRLPVMPQEVEEIQLISERHSPSHGAITAGKLDARLSFVPRKQGQLYAEHRRCTYPRREEPLYDQLVWKALPLFAVPP